MAQVMTDERKQYIKMTTQPVPRLIATLAVPTIISMMVTSIYNMADTFFVGKLGTSATGAVGVVFSLMAIIQALGFMLGMGSGGVVSRLLGQQKNREASRVASTAFFTAIFVGLCITVFGMIGINGLMRILGATDTILPYAKSYAQYILFGAPIMCASFVMNNDLRAEGKAILSMVGIATGGIINIILDPIFIFVFHMGIAGAAIATLISQCVSFLILLSNYVCKRSILTIHVKLISTKWSTYKQIITTGLPSLLRQGLASIAGISLNLNAAMYGDAAVAAMSIVNRVFLFVLSAMLGFGQGFQPVAGYNYGAKLYHRVKQAYWFCLKVGTIGLSVLAVLGFLFAPQVIGAFQKTDMEVLSIGARAFRLQCLAIPFHAMIVVSNMLFQSIGAARQATFIAAARQGLYFMPIIYLLPRIWGLFGVQCAQPLADILTFASCIPVLYFFFRNLNRQMKQEEDVLGN